MTLPPSISPTRLAMLLCAVLLVLGAVVVPRPAWTSSSSSGPPVRYLALIVIDGFRPDYAHLAPMPNLRGLMNSGTSYTTAWVGQLESQTPTGHATLATGTYPRKHGVIGFGWRDLTTNGFSWMPTDMRRLNAGGMEKLIESGGVPTLSDLLHRLVPGAKAASLSGEKYYAADALGTGADYILYAKRRDKAGMKGLHIMPVGEHVPPAATRYWEAGTSRPAYPDVQDQLVARLAGRLVSTVRPRLLLINLPGTDIQGHISGGVTDPGHMRPVIAQVDRSIGEIIAAYRAAGLYSHTIFVVTADHGMVPSSHLVPIKRMYAGVRATHASDLEDDFLQTAGYVYLRSTTLAATVAARLAALHYPHVEGAFYRTGAGAHSFFRPAPSTARFLGPALSRAYQDLCDTMASPAGPEVVLPYTEDAMGLTVPGSSRWGNHGGLSWGVQHIPLVISGPGVRHASSAFPAQLVDVAPTVEHLLGWPVPGGVDGVVLGDALARPSPMEVAAQKRVLHRRSQDVDALFRHSLEQHGSTLYLSGGAEAGR